MSNSLIIRPTGIMILGVLLIMASGCGSSTDTNQQQLNDREYVLTVSHEGQPLIEATCTYLGKSPKDAKSFQSKFKHDYRGKNTDFYEVTLTNKSARSVSINRVDYEMKYGDYRGKSSFDGQEIAKTWNSSEIPPNGSVVRDSHFVWAVKDTNVLYKTYNLKTTDDEGTPLEFELEISLLYKR
jgi:hypothetical protein